MNRSTCRYLLFAGSQDAPGGGLRDLVATFQSEPAALAAFRLLRQRTPADGSWAELAAVHVTGRVRAMCWFGERTAHPDGGARLWRPPPSEPVLPRQLTPA